MSLLQSNYLLLNPDVLFSSSVNDNTKGKLCMPMFVTAPVKYSLLVKNPTLLSPVSDETVCGPVTKSPDLLKVRG